MPGQCGACDRFDFVCFVYERASLWFVPSFLRQFLFVVHTCSVLFSNFFLSFSLHVSSMIVGRSVSCLVCRWVDQFELGYSVCRIYSIIFNTFKIFGCVDTMPHSPDSHPLLIVVTETKEKKK